MLTPRETIGPLLANMGAHHVHVAWRQGGMPARHLSWSSKGIPFDGMPVLYDLASLTKAFTATAVLLLVDRGELALHDPVQRYFPDFQRGDVTVEHLLTHTSMLDLYLSHVRQRTSDPFEIRRHIFSAGKKAGDYFYQDPNMIVLGWLVEHITGEDLEHFLTREVFVPLSMQHTSFRPRQREGLHIVEMREGKRGIVHDETAQMLGGISGHAGLFSTTRDLLQFLRMWMEQGQGILRHSTVKSAVSPRFWSSDGVFGQGLGWKKNAPKEGMDAFLSGALMHGGFTGTFMLFHPERQLEIVLLSDFVFPGERTEAERVQWWRQVREIVKAVACT